MSTDEALLRKIRDIVEEHANRSAFVVYKHLESLLALRDYVGDNRALPEFHDWSLTPSAMLAILRVLEGGDGGRLLELGSGSSTQVLARCATRLGLTGIMSLEEDGDVAQRVRTALHRNLRDFSNAVVKHAPLISHGEGGNVRTFYDLRELDGAFDIVLIDGPSTGRDPTARGPALPLLLPYLRPGALVLLDDAHRSAEASIVQGWEASGFIRDVRFIGFRENQVAVMYTR